MGKSTQPFEAFPKNRVLKKKSQNRRSEATNTIRKKPDIIDSYLRTLSGNFGSTTTSKRKIDETNDEDTVPDKKCKLDENTSFDENSPTILTGNNIKFEYLTTHLEYNDELRDLFHLDDARSSNEYTYYVDWSRQLCDEISLEGLDGITIEALWSRMMSNSAYPVLLHGKEEIFWNLLKSIDQIEYYILEQPRENLKIYDKNHYVCPESGIVLEPMIDSGEIYPVSMVNKDGVRGSCHTYDSRMKNCEVIKKLGLEETLNIYGNRLVLVASQKMRERAILSEIADPSIELGDNEYGLLERVGRARGYGELTQGKVSLLNMFKDSQTIFHLRKSLEGKKLLKNQFFMLRNPTTGQNKTGKLLQLPRFYKLQKNKTVLLIEEIVELLRRKPGYRLEFGEFKKYFPRSTGVNKILKIPEFTKYIKTDIFHPYRFLYPNATAAEWKYKKKDKEKILRIFQLIDPTINVAATWNSGYNDDILEEEDEEIGGQGSKMIDFDCLAEVYSFIFKAGKGGVTLQELVKQINFNYYTVRISIRKLQAKNQIDSVKTEQGKQRHIYYFARCFHSKNTVMPERKTKNIPHNLLQKIRSNKKSPTKNLEICFKPPPKCERDSRLCYPIKTSTLRKETPSVEIKMSYDEFIAKFSRWIIPSKETPISLPDIQVVTKYCDVVYEVKQINRHFPEIPNIITSFSESNAAIKVMLFKLMQDTNINVQNLLEADTDQNHQMDMLTLDFETVTSRQITNKDFLLGPNPVQASHEITTENIEITITLSTPPESYKYSYDSYVAFDKNITLVSLKRTNIILDEINKNLVICDIYRLQRVIAEQETTGDKKDGLGKIDKITIYRILVRLVEEGYIKIFKFFMTSTEKYKTQWILAHPSIDVPHPLMQGAKEQVVVKFFLGMDRRNIATTEKPKKKPEPFSPFDSEEATNSLETLKQISRTKSNVVYKQSRIFGRILGYQPKFVRMQLFHELLYYLLYDYKQIDRLSHSDIDEILPHYNPEDVKEIPPIYQKTVDWKMFIPPLPVHKKFANGWALLCDVILSIPLSLWVKVFHISIECPQLFTYLGHPIRQHYLIKDIPIDLRHVLLHKRKYLFNAVELVYRLCFIGLVQLGPQSTVVKDQIFLYLNRRATLLDTSSSGPSYHLITQKKYEELQFTFNSTGDVEDYWCQLWTISMNTPLGQRRIMEGESVTIEPAVFKGLLLDSLKAKTPEEVLENDDGRIPGDRRGAGGLDSSMWFHIKRNWLWSSRAPKSTITEVNKQQHSIRGANIASIRPVAIKYKELINQSRKIYMTNRTKEIPATSNYKKNKKIKVIHRKITTKKPPPRLKKDELDVKDKMIIKKVGKIFRAKFNKEEDEILYMCRAANYFLSKNNNVFKASRFIVRDILHVLHPKSQDKTSMACARRLAKLERSDLFMKRLRERAHELISMKDLSPYFAPIIFNLNKTAQEASSCYSCYSTMDKNTFFVHAVWYIYQNYDSAKKIISGDSKSFDYFSPNNVETFSSLLVNIENKKSVFNTPCNQGDIEKEVIKSVLMSALNCSKLGQNISYQFYQICKKYSDTHIRAAVASSKSYQAISVNKKKQKTTTTLKSIPFQLSITYNHMQKSIFSVSSLKRIYEHISREIFELPALVQTKGSLYSRLLARNEIAAAWPKYKVSLSIPDALLNPHVQKHSALVSKVAESYQEFLKKNVGDPTNKMKRINNRITMKILGPATKRFTSLKSNIKALLSSLPCYYNKTISVNLPLFLQCNEEEQIIKYLEDFLEELFKIVLNLFSAESGGVELLEGYIAKYYRTKKIETLVKELEFKIYKLGYIIKQYLITHDLTNIIHCFENEQVETNQKLKEIIQKWFDKAKMVSSEQTTNEDGKNGTQNKQSALYKFKMNNIQSNIKIIKSLEDIPQIEEIVEGMLEPNTNFTRSVPHISDIVCLLSKEKRFDNDDETLLEELRQNFFVDYPKIGTFEIEDLDRFKTSFKHLVSREELPDLEEIVNRSCHIKESNTVGMIKIFKEMGGTSDDHLLAGEIISYVYNKKCMGATGAQIMKTFGSKKKNLDLHVIVEVLCSCYILLEVGINEKIFVHIEQSNAWLVETFHLSPHENHLLHASVNGELQTLQEKIESRIQSTKPVKVIMMPWLHLDGTFNGPLLEKWLTIVLSFCLQKNNCSLEYLFEKFYLVKPVELYFIVKVLQELKCLSIYTLEGDTEDLWEDTIGLQKRPANILDSFTDMLIELNPLATACLGHFLSEEDVES